MIYITILMTLIGNIESNNSEINKTWILTDYHPKNWCFSTERVDILKFNENSNLEMISIEEGTIRSVKYTINNENQIILDSKMNFGQIKLIDKNQLIIQNAEGNTSIEKIYFPLPESELGFSESEIIQKIKNHNWKIEIERQNNKGKMIWNLSDNEEENEFEIQLAINSEGKKLIMPAELKKVDNCLFLSCEIPNTFGDATSESNLGRENYIIQKITKDEILISFGSNVGLGIQSFTKEK